MSATQQIECTSEYERFKNFSYNRKHGVNKSKLGELITSISSMNYLHLHPIIVDDEFNIIDGQHRLKAAQKLGVPVYYIRESGISQKHIMTANTAQSSWSVEDIINFYALKDLDTDYTYLNEMMASLKLKPKGMFGLLFGTCNKNLLDMIKKGFFKLPKNNMSEIDRIVKSYQEFISFVEERRIKPRSMFSNSMFTQAFRLITLNRTFKMDLFLQKLENKWFDLKPQLNTQEWFNVLIKIYNWHNKNDRIDDGVERNM